MKKSNNKPVFKSVSDAEKFLDDLVSGSNDQMTLDDIFGGESNDNLKLLDKWVEKQLLGNPEIKPYNKRPYPYRKYHMLDELLRKHGKEFISKMRASMPRNLKKNTDEDTLIDSVAWIIWDKKLDAKSIMSELPEFGSIWDKISEDGYAE